MINDIAYLATRPNEIRSKGKVKIWSEKKCKGKSLDVAADVDDLRTVGFDDAISSIFLG